MKVFLATSFSSKVDPTGTVLLEFRQKVEAIIARYEAAGREVLCAIKDNGWKMAPMDSATREFSKDMSNIKQCDEFVALIDETISAGVQMEIGYALGLNKRITLITEGKTQLNWTNHALIGLSNVTHLPI